MNYTNLISTATTTTLNHNLYNNIGADSHLTISSNQSPSSSTTGNDKTVSYLWQFSNSYRPIHGWLSTGVCLFGIPSNLLNIIVLTRPHMISSPTNLILTGLAASDLLTMLSSLLFSFYFYVIHSDTPIHEPSPHRDTKLWTHFAKIHVMASVTFHSLSIWLTVYLAIFRYIYLITASPSTFSKTSSTKQRHLTTKVINKTTKFQRFLTKSSTYTGVIYGILFICLFCIIFCFPAYLYPTVREKAHMPIAFSLNQSSENNYLYSNRNTSSMITSTNSGSNTEYVYYVAQSDLDISSNGLIFKIMFYLQAIFGKFLPCLLLVTFSCLLIHSLVIINRNNKKLAKSGTYSSSTNTLNNINNKMTDQRTNIIKPNKCTILMRSLFKIKNSEIENNKKSIDQAKSSVKNEEQMNDLVAFDNEEDELILEDSNENNNLKNGSSKLKPVTKQTSVNNNLKEAKQTPTATATKTKLAKRNKVKENLRTTLMLIVVCILFLLTEFPQAVLMFFSIVMGNTFYENVYMPLGDFMDIIALINNAINFLLYCIMSRQFRETCYKLLSSLWCFNNTRNGTNHLNNNNNCNNRNNYNNKILNTPQMNDKGCKIEMKNIENI